MVVLSCSFCVSPTSVLHAHSSFSGYSGPFVLIFELLLGCPPRDTCALRAYASSAPGGVNASANATANVAVLSCTFCVSPTIPWVLRNTS